MADSAVKIPFIEATAPSTPAANRVVIYCKSDGLMYSKDDAGTETLMSAGGGGIPATILDAKGDIIAASAADTAAKLTAGANGLVLTTASGETTGLKWAVPTVPFVTADSTADVNLTADTAADATGVSVSLAAGTWYIDAMMNFATPSTTTYTVLYIADSSNNYYAASRGIVTSAAPITCNAHAIVTPGSTTTYKLRGQVGFTNADIIRFGVGAVIGTRMTAVRLL